MLFCLFPKCKASVGPGVGPGHAPLAPLPRRGSRQPSSAAPGLAPAVAGGRLGPLLAAQPPPSPRATFAPRWELRSRRERPSEPFSFQPAFIEFHLHFVSFANRNIIYLGLHVAEVSKRSPLPGDDC